jgi:hypothetical protein
LDFWQKKGFYTKNWMLHICNIFELIWLFL